MSTLMPNFISYKTLQHMSVSLLHDAKHNLMRPNKWDRETHMDLFVCNEDCS